MIDAPLALKRQYGTRSLRVETTSNGAPVTDEFALDGLGTNQAFLDLIRDRRVESIHSQETTLESIFIQVTGKSLT